MTDIRKYDDELYQAIYFDESEEKTKRIWDSIKNNDEILKEAIKLEKNKFGDETIKGLAICDTMLTDYKNVNQEIYQELVNLIYSNTRAARTVLNGFYNSGYSFLLMTLWNHDLKLTEEQKQFAVNEAMNKVGTIKREKEKEIYSKKLDEIGITDDKITYMEFGGYLTPVGAKSANIYIQSMISSLDDSQAHGTGPFDIRFEILRNPNWTIEEKQKLVYDFWTDDEHYEESLEQWEWSIINADVDYRDQILPRLFISDLYDYTYNDLLCIYSSKETADKIWKDIIFCQSMHELRPMKWEKEFDNQKVLK